MTLSDEPSVRLTCKSHEQYLKLKEMGYLLVATIEFNTDSQLYEVNLRAAGWRDT